MKQYIIGIFVLSFLLIAISFSQNKFVGTNTCACHNLPKQGKQVEVWKKSKHAEAFNTLKSAKAAEYAKAKGIKSAVEAKECLECHTTGYGEPQEKSFKMDMGVQCEACHGAASGYKGIHNKPENKEKAVAAGLILPKEGDDTLCKTCHTPKMHEMKEFNYKKMWEEIKHPMPKG